MFGIARRRAVKAAVASLRPTLITMQNTGGIPEGFWRDEFVLGYMSCAIGIFMTMANGKPLGREMGQGYIEVVAELTGTDGLSITKQMAELLHHPTVDSSKGVSAADRIITVAVGQTTHDTDPDVKMARLLASDPRFPNFGGSGSANSKASAHLLQTLFFEVIYERLGARTSEN